MLTRTLHTKWFTRFFLLIYLLLSFSTANASFWCQGAENTSRLEFNSFGQCFNNCQPVDDESQHGEKATTTGVFWSALVWDCFDSPVYSSIITPSNRTSPLSKIAAPDIASVNSSFIPAQIIVAARYANLTFATQLPTPHALTTLRTVVLLR